MEAGLSTRRLGVRGRTGPRPKVSGRVDLDIGDDAKKEHRRLSV
jgi:hypothetical protein